MTDVVGATVVAVVEVVVLGVMVVEGVVLVVARSTGRSVVVGASASLTHPTAPSKTAQSADERAFRMPTPPAKETVLRSKKSTRGCLCLPWGAVHTLVALRARRFAETGGGCRMGSEVS